MCITIRFGSGRRPRYSKTSLKFRLHLPPQKSPPRMMAERRMLLNHQILPTMQAKKPAKFLHWGRNCRKSCRKIISSAKFCRCRVRRRYKDKARHRHSCKRQPSPRPPNKLTHIYYLPRLLHLLLNCINKTSIFHFRSSPFTKSVVMVNKRKSKA